MARWHNMLGDRMSDPNTADELSWDERLRQARESRVGDLWRKRKQPEHYAEVLSTDGAGHLKMKHWNGRVTGKWYSYLASDYYLAKRKEQ
jgi:hypothetical protein